MLEKPNIPDEDICAHLVAAFGLPAARVEFLPLGSDANTAVYRVTTEGGKPYFLKLRSGTFEPLSVLVPRFLRDQGIRQVIEPIRAASGEPWSRLDRFTCVLYLYIEGQNAWAVPLSDAQWLEFGAALRRVQSVPLPAELKNQLPVETYSAQYREQVKGFLSLVEKKSFTDPVSARMAVFMSQHRDAMLFVTGRAEALARKLMAQPLPAVLCHADLHAGNLLVTPSGDFSIVDWDNPILAPKERDLMFIGAGIGGNWNTAREVSLFYEGYGPAEINRTALAYYRYERIVQDFAAYCEEILLTEGSSPDREQGLRYFMSNFDPGSTIEIAWRSDPTG